MKEKAEKFLEIYKDEICSQLQNFVENLENIKELEKPEIKRELFKQFPFVELVYILDENGIQITDNIINPIFKGSVKEGGKGKDRSSKSYYKDVISNLQCKITKPYTSIATGKPTVTISIPVIKDGKLKYIFVADISLNSLFFSSKREKLKFAFELFSKTIYTIFVFILLGLSFKLTYAGILQIIKDKIEIQHIFESIILVTLGLAIFELGKTVFEEEVILFKDPRRHSEIRKTLVRFLASVLVAVSIEALMLVFKFTMANPQKLVYAFGLFLSVGFLIIAIGIYVYLGVKAEIRVREYKQSKENN